MHNKVIFYGIGGNARLNIGRWISLGLEPVCFVDMDTTKHHTMYTLPNDKKIEILPLIEAIEKYPDYKLYLTQVKTSHTSIIGALTEMGIPIQRIKLCLANNPKYNYEGTPNCDDVILYQKYLNFSSFLNNEDIKFTRIKEGFDNSSKYYVQTLTERFFLITFSPKNIERVKTQFEIMKKASLSGIPVPQPREFGILDWAGAYLLLDWIDGEILKIALPNVSPMERYELGVSAGKNLLKLHSIPTDDMFLAQYEFCIYSKFQTCSKDALGIHKDLSAKLITYIETNKSLLEDKHKVILHSDFSCANMMLSAGKLVIIDFNITHYGVKWCDTRFLYTQMAISPHFAVGFLHGYFEKKISSQTWKLLLLYNALRSVEVLASLPLLHNHPDMIKRIIDTTQTLLYDIKKFSSTAPCWYIRAIKELNL